MSQKEPSKKKEKKARKKEIECFFRENQGSHLRLSEYADRNANTMILANSIIITALIYMILIKAYSYLMIPVVTLLASTTSALILAVLSSQFTLAKPFIAKVDPQDAEKLNLLYSGQFQKISFLQYEESLLRKFEDQDVLVGNSIQTDYLQGVVLGKKYLVLRICNIIFLVGFALSILLILFNNLNF